MHGLLGGGAKAKEPTPAERDGAGCKPGPAENEPREGVREPVHVKEYARARDGDGDARCDAGQQRASVPADAAAENQRRAA